MTVALKQKTVVKGMAKAAECVPSKGGKKIPNDGKVELPMLPLASV